MDEIRVQQVLQVIHDFDRFGGASLELVAWELMVEERVLLAAWARATNEGWIASSEPNEQGEQMWRLTPAGRDALLDPRSAEAS